MKKALLVFGLTLIFSLVWAADQKEKTVPTATTQKGGQPSSPKGTTPPQPVVEEHGIYQYSFKNIDGEEVSLSQFKGKPLLIVNIATRCGYTHQLEGLQALHTQFKDKGLVVIGFPSNDFGGQTPEKENGVKDFCKVNFGVDFLLSEKVEVLGPKKNPIFEELISAQKDKKEIS